MGSNYFGGGNDQRGVSSSSPSSSSRKGKKNTSDKPKQPQRGLGVAQLEKIRLHSQLGCNYLPNSLHTPPYTTPNFTQEDMRLQTAYSSSSPPSFSYSSSSSPSYGFQTPTGLMMGLTDHFDRANIRYADSQPSTTVARWHPGNPALGSQQYMEPSISTRSFFEPALEGSMMSNENKKRRNDSLGSSSDHNSECGSSQDIDLELRLSL